MTEPKVTVIVPSVTGLSDLSRCLEALSGQEPPIALDIVVPERLGEKVRCGLASRFPHVRVLPMAENTTIPQMRAQGVKEAHGEVIGIIEDHVLVPKNWVQRMLQALSESDGVVAGAVANGAHDSLFHRAAFLCEYSHILPPIPGGEVSWLTGNNVFYRKELLSQFAEVIDGASWENVWHDKFRQAGIRLLCFPDIVVKHDLRIGPFDYLSQRYHYARSYAGARLKKAGITKKLAFAFGSLLLPILLLWRMLKRVLSKNKLVGTYFLSLPILVVFVVGWALGELVGSLFGAGSSLAKVR